MVEGGGARSAKYRVPVQEQKSSPFRLRECPSQKAEQPAVLS